MYRLRTPEEDVMKVVTLLAHGCPPQAIVHAFGVHEETVANWWERAGEQCKAVHEHVVESQQMDLEHVQADEIRVKQVGQVTWMAMAIMVSTRLWLSGVISPKRDKHLIRQLADKIRLMALKRPLLLAVDGLASYVGAFRRAFRSPELPTGKPRRPRLIAWKDVAIVQVIKRKTPTFYIERRIVQGSQQLIDCLRERTQGFLGVTNTAYIERINATFRQRLACLTRRSRCAAHHISTVTHGMFVVGCFYNFCLPHTSLQQQVDSQRIPRTPAMAAGLSDSVWTARELLLYKVPPKHWIPKRPRGRPSRAFNDLIRRCAPYHL